MRAGEVSRIYCSADREVIGKCLINRRNGGLNHGRRRQQRDDRGTGVSQARKRCCVRRRHGDRLRIGYGGRGRVKAGNRIDRANLRADAPTGSLIRRETQGRRELLGLTGGERGVGWAYADRDRRNQTDVDRSRFAIVGDTGRGYRDCLRRGDRARRAIRSESSHVIVRVELVV